VENEANDPSPLPEPQLHLITNNDSDIIILKEDQYLSNDITEKRTSLLTQSLKHPSNLTDKNADVISIKVYLFDTAKFLKIEISIEDKVLDLIKKTIIACIHKTPKPIKLPYGTKSEGYDVCIMDYDSHMPDIDLIIDKSLKLKDLNEDCLGLCCSPTYEPESPMRNASIIRISEFSRGKILRVKYQKNCSVVSIEPSQKLVDVFYKLLSKFSIDQHSNHANFEFKIDVAVDSVYQSEECPVDMNINVCDLQTDQIKLCQKVFIDSPS